MSKTYKDNDCKQDWNAYKQREDGYQKARKELDKKEI